MMPLRSTRLASSAVAATAAIPAAVLTATAVSAAALAADAAASVTTAAAWACEEEALSHAPRRPRVQASSRNCQASRSRRRGGGLTSEVPEPRHAQYAHRFAEDTPRRARTTRLRMRA